MEQIIEEKILENVSGGGSNPEPSKVTCPNCGKEIRLTNGLFISGQPGVCKCGYKLGEKWL